MKIIKPMSLALLNRPYRHGGQQKLLAVALGFFPLGQDGENADRLLVEPPQWPRVLRWLPPGQPLDMVMPKAGGEVLLCGQAHAPGQRPVRQMTVRLQMGAVDKTLRVIGDRRWSCGLAPVHQIGAPAAFTAVPLDYAHAYGGRGHDGNPLGRGYTGHRWPAFVGPNEGLMPNVEYPDQPVRDHWRRLAPASFAPIDPTWSRPKGMAGSYGKRWREHEAPGLPSDIDLRYFCSAPLDQRVPQAWRGGEAYRLEGLDPEQPLVGGRLPALRARIFLQAQSSATGPCAGAGSPQELREVPLLLDTVWFFPEAGCGVLVWRGSLTNADSDARDVGVLLGAYERSVDPPRPLSHYAEVIALRTDPGTAVQHAFNESQLTPTPTLRQQQQRADARAVSLQEARERRSSAIVATLEQLPPELRDKAAARAAAAADHPVLDCLSSAEIASGDFDLTEYMARAQAELDRVRREGDERLAALAPAPQPLPAESQERQALDRAAQAGTLLTHEQLLALPPGDPRLGQALQRQQRRGPLKPAALALSTPLEPSAAQALGRQALDWLRGGTSLAARDLAGADLRGAQLQAADLREALLEAADLRGADLRGALFNDAALQSARLDGADLRGAVLDGANLSNSSAKGTRCAGASLRRATVIDAQWQQADLSDALLDECMALRIDLTGAILDRASLNQATLVQAKASGSRWRGARARMLLLLQATLEHADFSQAVFERCVLTGVKGNDSVWLGARLDTVHAGGDAQWERTHWAQVQARKCGFRGTRFNQAQLAGGEFLSCDFGQTDLTGADLRGCLLARSLLDGARLIDALACDADFFSTLARKADFSGADLCRANVVLADLSEARFDRACTRDWHIEPHRRRA